MGQVKSEMLFGISSASLGHTRKRESLRDARVRPQVLGHAEEVDKRPDELNLVFGCLERERACLRGWTSQLPTTLPGHVQLTHRVLLSAAEPVPLRVGEGPNLAGRMPVAPESRREVRDVIGKVDHELVVWAELSSVSFWERQLSTSRLQPRRRNQPIAIPDQLPVACPWVVS